MVAKGDGQGDRHSNEDDDEDGKEAEHLPAALLLQLDALGQLVAALPGADGSAGDVGLDRVQLFLLAAYESVEVCEQLSKLT